jgi:hypothetical protein
MNITTQMKILLKIQLSRNKKIQNHLDIIQVSRNKKKRKELSMQNHQDKNNH